MRVHSSSVLLRLFDLLIYDQSPRTYFLITPHPTPTHTHTPYISTQTAHSWERLPHCICKSSQSSDPLRKALGLPMMMRSKCKSFSTLKWIALPTGPGGVLIWSDISHENLNSNAETQQETNYSEICLRRLLKGQEKVVAVARWSSYPGSVGHVTISACDTSL